MVKNDYLSCSSPPTRKKWITLDFHGSNTDYNDYNTSNVFSSLPGLWCFPKLHLGACFGQGECSECCNRGGMPHPLHWWDCEESAAWLTSKTNNPTLACHFVYPTSYGLSYRFSYRFSYQLLLLWARFEENGWCLWILWMCSTKAEWEASRGTERKRQREGTLHTIWQFDTSQ